MDVIVDGCAGLDVHKETVMATVRSPDGYGGRGQMTREFPTFRSRLVALRDWLVAEGVSQVAMEPIGVYWEPVWHVLEEASGLELLSVNPAQFKNLPGRKTDVADSRRRQARGGAAVPDDGDDDCSTRPCVRRPPPSTGSWLRSTRP